MLVRFDSKAGTITMFGEVAKQLLRLMGQSGAVPGALLAQDIASAVERLRQAISGQAEKTAPPRDTQDEGEPPVNVRQRAFPLIELLERAAKQKADVIWEEERRTAF
jgi:uncharacterized protein DUF1840